MRRFVAAADRRQREVTLGLPLLIVLECAKNVTIQCVRDADGNKQADK